MNGWHGNKRVTGLTLVEVLLTVVILGIMVTSLTTIYMSGFHALAAQEEQIVFDSALRSRMELILSHKFGSLSGGSDMVSVGGVDYPVTWTVQPADLNQDTVAESTALLVQVTGMGRSLTRLVVDAEGRVAKIP